jgi:hypothetical protein
MAPHATVFSALGVLSVFGALDENNHGRYVLTPWGHVFLTPTMTIDVFCYVPLMAAPL